MKSKSRQLPLDTVRTAAILLVTLNHAINRSFSNYWQQSLDFTKYSAAANVFKALVTVVSHAGVPLFLMLTGYLILRKSFRSEESFKRFFRHNWLRMILTTEIWLAVMFWFIYFLSPSSGMEGWSAGKLILHFFMNAFFLEDKYLGNMWYMMMIIPVYTVLPLLSVYLENGNKKALIPPAALVFVASFLIPGANHILMLMNSGKILYLRLYAAELFSMYIVYILLGYYFQQKPASRFPARVYGCVFLLLLIAGTAVQYVEYRHPMDILMEYESPMIFLLSAVLFRFLLSLKPRRKFLVDFVTYTSRISFGIYFVHIILMEAMDWTIGFTGWNPVLKFFFLEIFALGGSYLLISLTSKIPFIKKYVYSIKD